MSHNNFITYLYKCNITGNNIDNVFIMLLWHVSLECKTASSGHWLLERTNLGSL